MNVNKININQLEPTYYIASDIYDVSYHNSGTSFASLSELLSSENLSTLIPTEVRCGGMTIRFLQSSDNKYVQFRYKLKYESTSEGNAAFLNTDNWVICDDSILVECPEYVAVYTDADGKIIIAVENDGNIHYGAGVPQQVIDYINTKTVSLDDYLDIVDFLGTLINGDKTLAELLNEKVDKVEGKSLIDEDVADRLSYVENPEYIGVFLDGQNHILMAFENDGNIHYGVGVPKQIKNYVDNTIGNFGDTTTLLEYLNDTYGEYTENPEFINTELDSEGKILGGRKSDGKKFDAVGFETPIISVDGVNIETVDDPEERMYLGLDAEKKILHYRDKDGVLHESVGFETPTINTNNINLTAEGMNDFQQALINNGFKPGGFGDWSNKSIMNISKPKCAMMNLITDFNLSNLSKSDRPNGVQGVNYDIPVQMEFYDNQGNYFKKWILLSAQGQSSFSYPKKAFAFDIFNQDPNAEDFDDGDTFSIKFGDWVPQDSFHCKAYYTDAFHGLGVIAYQLYDDILATRTFDKNRAWKKALLPNTINDYSLGGSEDNIEKLDIRYDTGARNFPDGFPIIAYQTKSNGTCEFYGIMSWLLKKHRDNYMMNKALTTNIHIDTGDMREPTWWQAAVGNEDWSGLEIRNPKPSKKKDGWELVDINGKKYNGDFPTELMGTDTLGYDSSNISHVKSAEVKASIETMRTCADDIDTAILGGATEEQVKAMFDAHFAMEEYIDYVCHALFTANYDGFYRNRQWTTYDGIIWQINPYDMDLIFGNVANGQLCTPATCSGSDYGANAYRMMGRILASPFRQFWNYYSEDVKARYAELRDKGVFTTKNVIDKLDAWVKAIGYDFFKKEVERWPDVPYNKNTVVADGWEEVPGEYPTGNTYNSTVTYNSGDTVNLNYRRFRATRTVTGVYPVTSVGHKDSLYRVAKWIDNRITLLDAWLEYKNN